jgi:hypothetical protein
MYRPLGLHGLLWASITTYVLTFVIIIIIIIIIIIYF